MHHKTKNFRSGERINGLSLVKVKLDQQFKVHLSRGNVDASTPKVLTYSGWGAQVLLGGTGSAKTVSGRLMKLSDFFIISIII